MRVTMDRLISTSSVSKGVSDPFTNSSIFSTRWRLLQELTRQVLLCAAVSLGKMIHSCRMYTTYTTAASKPGQEVGCFEQKIKMSNGKTLDVIGVDTELLQDSILRGSLRGNQSNQLHWLIRTLQAKSSYWRIVVGYQPLVICGQNKEQMMKKQVFEYLHRTFLKFAVNIYLNGQDCTNYATDGSVAYIGNPGLIEKEPYSVFLNGKYVFSRALANGFLLHRVSSMQIVTYYINLTGEVACKTVLQQKGTEVM